MRTTIMKTGRIADVEVIIQCRTPAQGSSELVKVNDFVKAYALKAAQDIKEYVTLITTRKEP